MPGSFPEDEAAGMWCWPLNYSALRLRINGCIPLLSSYAFKNEVRCILLASSVGHCCSVYLTTRFCLVQTLRIYLTETLFSNVLLLACLYMHRGNFNSCSADSTTLKTVHYCKGLCIWEILYNYVCVCVCKPAFLNCLESIIYFLCCKDRAFGNESVCTDQRNVQVFNLFIYLLLPYMFRAFF
jgi:hypothetical protein